jgi:hypothetical protein
LDALAVCTRSSEDKRTYKSSFCLSDSIDGVAIVNNHTNNALTQTAEIKTLVNTATSFNKLVPSSIWKVGIAFPPVA